MLDDQGNEVFAVDMEVDEETYPLENVTDLNQYLDKPSTDNQPIEKDKRSSHSP
ncbi:unnamed protein product [Rhizopus stolonifer]